MNKLKVVLALGLPLMVAYSQSGYAQPQFMTQISNYCASHGSVAVPLSCATCHTGTGAPSENNANGPMARVFDSGNLAAFCGPSTGPVTTPPVVTPPTMTPPPSSGGSHEDGHSSHHEGSRSRSRSDD